MRNRLLPVALALCAGLASPGARGQEADSLELLILGGGKTRADAELWLAHWRRAEAEVGVFLAPAAGYPRVLESASLPGLKPGFHIVALGACPAGEAEPRLAALKAFFPGTYTREVRGAAPGCPGLRPEAALLEAAGLSKGPLRLRVLSFQPAYYGAGTVAIRSLLFRADRLQEVATELHQGEGGEGSSQLKAASLRQTRAAIRASVTTTHEDWSTGAKTRTGTVHTTYSLTEEGLKQDRSTEPEDAFREWFFTEDTGDPPPPPPPDPRAWPPRHPVALGALAFSPDGRRLATGGGRADNYYGLVRVWDLDAGRLQAELAGQAPVDLLAFSDDGARVLFGGHTPLVHLGHLPDRGPPRTFRMADAVPGLAIAPSGLALAAGQRNYLGVLQLEAPGRTNTLLGHELDGVVAAFSRDGSLLASGAGDGQVWLWEAASGLRLRGFAAGAGRVRLLAFSQDAQALLALCDQAAVVFALAAEAPPRRIALGLARPSAFAASADGASFAVADGERVRVWSASAEAPRQELRLPGVRALALSPDGRRLAIGTVDGAVRLTDAHSGAELPWTPAAK